jgi:ribosome-associated protein
MESAGKPPVKPQAKPPSRPDIKSKPPTVSIPQDELQFTYARSSGKGGQNVNKVNSKAVLKWSPTTSRAMPGAVRERFLEKFATRLTNEGDLVIMSDEHRDQGRNVSECIDRLKDMIMSVWRAPKVRRATKPTFGSKMRRLKGKKEHSEKKQNRKYKGD